MTTKLPRILHNTKLKLNYIDKSQCQTLHSNLLDLRQS